MVTEEQTRTVQYCVSVPRVVTREYEVCVHDCVPREQVETYTVCVPVQVEKEYDVQVCRMVPRTVKQCVPVCVCQ
jgi:hypothetical protein